MAAVACAPAGEQEEPAVEEAASLEQPLEGAWKAVEVSVTAADTSWTATDLQPSLYIFAAQHYSIMFVPDTEPRQLFSGDDPVLGLVEPTDAEKVAAFDSFIANSGTYGVSGSTLTTRPIVAKTPNFMAGGSLTFTYQIEGDTLWLTLRLPWEEGTEQRTKLVRLE
jgi:hypothetical protein